MDKLWSERFWGQKFYCLTEISKQFISYHRSNKHFSNSILCYQLDLAILKSLRKPNLRSQTPTSTRNTDLRWITSHKSKQTQIQCDITDDETVQTKSNKKKLWWNDNKATTILLMMKLMKININQNTKTALNYFN